MLSKNMTLREKVYRTFILNVKRMKGPGTIKELFDKYPVGGLYYAKGPAEDLIEMLPGDTQTRADFVKKCKAASRFPLIICADGATIEDGCRPCGPAALGATDSEEDAYNYGKAIGMQMNYNGIDMVLGPCVDLSIFRCTESVSSTMSNDAEYSAKMYRQVIRGIQDQNVGATAKHFPGLGTYHVNMHISAGQNVLPFDEWMNTYGHVYKEAFKEDLKCVMTSHVTLRSYSEKADYGTQPIATHSKDITIGLLKEKLGFDGVVVTDALTMGGCAIENQVEEAVAAFACGADFLLWPPVEAGERIIEELEAGRIPMSRLDDAMERIDRFTEWLRIKDKDRERYPADPKFVDKTFTEIAKKGITLIRNEVGNLPLNKERKRVMIDLVSPQSKINYGDEALNATNKLIDILKEEGFEVELKTNYVNFLDNSIKEEIKDYDYIIILLSSPFSIGATRDCFNSAWTVHLLPTAKKVFVNFSSAFFIDDYYPDEKTFVHTNCGLNTANIKAVADAILGKEEMTGKLMRTDIKL